MRIELYLHENNSLKGKRKVVKSLIGKVKHKFNVAIAETGSNDKWQKIELGISTVGNDRRHLESSFSSVLNFIDSLFLAEIIASETEIFNM